jgi:hypothetical protein
MVRIRVGIAPTAAGSQDVKDPADDATIVDPARTGLMTRQQRLDDRPGHVVEPKEIAHDLSDPKLHRSLFESRLHHPFNV